MLRFVVPLYAELRELEQFGFAESLPQSDALARRRQQMRATSYYVSALDHLADRKANASFTAAVEFAAHHGFLRQSRAGMPNLVDS
jgi:hypothetical protein